MYEMVLQRSSLFIERAKQFFSSVRLEVAEEYFSCHTSLSFILQYVGVIFNHNNMIQFRLTLKCTKDQSSHFCVCFLVWKWIFLHHDFTQDARIYYTTVLVYVVINNSSYPTVKNNNTVCHAFGKYWMQTRGHRRIQGAEAPPWIFSYTFFDRWFPTQKCPLGRFFCIAFK